MIFRASLFFWILVSFFYFLFYFSVLSEEQSYIGKEISRIEFRGLRNLSSAELYEVITSRYQQPFLRSAISEDVRRLFATGYFSNVIMRIRLLKNDTLAISYEVEEFPQIEDVEYIGFSELDSQNFIQKVEVQAGEFYTLEKVKRSVQAIKEVYIENGFFQVEVWYRVPKIDKETNRVTVFFIIDEGETIPISKINILGTRHLDTDAILSVLEQKESGWFSDAPFQQEKFEQDKFRILAYAKSQGLLDAQIDGNGTNYEIHWNVPGKLEEGRVIVITYKIIEGDIKYFGGYSLEHSPQAINRELNPSESVLKAATQLQPIYSVKTLLNSTAFSNENLGQKFDGELYLRDLAILQQSYARQGYVFTRIKPQVVEFDLDEKTLKNYESCLQLKKPKTATQKKCKKEASWLPLPLLRSHLQENSQDRDKVLRHVHFQIFENNLAYVENIIIRGNDKTNEHIIRRELLIKEGQLFNVTLATLSRQVLLNLPYFSEVNLEQRIGSDQNKMNLVFIVKERATGTISLGGSYAVDTGFSINARLSESNLYGSGHRVSTALDYGPNRRSFEMNWSQPWFYESCQSATGTFWRKKQQAFDSASHLAEIIKLADTLNNDYEAISRTIRNYVNEAKTDEGIVSLDRVKLRIRDLLAYLVIEEEDCFRSLPSPWSLSLGTSILNTYSDNITSIGNTGVVSSSERAYRQLDVITFSLGTSHQFTSRWAHYHYYRPSLVNYGKPNSLATDLAFFEARENFQFKSSLTNGLIYSNLDQSFNPTDGTRLVFELEVTGNFLGGKDHYNRYTMAATQYFSWFDYTFFGLLPFPFLKHWRMVQQVNFRGTFTQVTTPLYDRDQDPVLNPFLEFNDRLRLGGAWS